MKKKILTFFYILVLHSNAHSASEPQLPPPLPLSQEIANPEKKEEYKKWIDYSKYPPYNDIDIA